MSISAQGPDAMAESIYSGLSVNISKIVICDLNSQDLVRRGSPRNSGRVASTSFCFPVAC